MSVKSKVLLMFIVVTSNWLVGSGDNVVKKNKQLTITDAPVSVDSRFFDLGQLLGPLFSNSNHNRPAGNLLPNPPREPQFQTTAQGNLPQGSNPGNSWRNPNQGSFDPPQNNGFNQQRPNVPNQWPNPQFSNPGIQNPSQLMQNGPNQLQNPETQGGVQNANYPNLQYPENNHNAPNWRPEYPNQIPNQFPYQGGSNGQPSQIQQPNQRQEWNKRPLPNPDQNRPSQFPDQDYQRPNNGFNNNPSNNNQYPPQDSDQEQGSGTLDDFMPQNNRSGNAILGKPVIVPTTTVSPDQIFFDNSTESPLQRQCVQDCPATPEYNPICGTNNVTYFNPGKFVCARNCGVAVYVARRGVCRRRPM